MSNSAEDSDSNQVGGGGSSFEEDDEELCLGPEADPDADAADADPVAQEMELVGGSGGDKFASGEDNFATAADQSTSSRERRRRAAMCGRRRRRVCIVPQCYSSEMSNPLVHLYSFPQHPVLSELWKRCVANPKLSTVASKLLCERQYVVCSQHFEDVCFENPSARRTAVSEARLKWNAVPTLGLVGGRSEAHPNGGSPLYAGSNLAMTSSATSAAGTGASSSADLPDVSSGDSSDCNDGNLVIVKAEQPPTCKSPTGSQSARSTVQPTKPLQPRQAKLSAAAAIDSHVASSSSPAISVAASSATIESTTQPPSLLLANGNNNFVSASSKSAPSLTGQGQEYSLLTRIVRIALNLDQAQTGMLRELCSLKRRQRQQQTLLGHLCDQLARSVAAQTATQMPPAKRSRLDKDDRNNGASGEGGSGAGGGVSL
ncbi:hypothetical protein BOX15_Mlig005026g3 [Macrostomum lignano]|uniref:THAP-type domain-containing protein n=1 Tax=Macrostomum lignano TaxID=282301 RepID=A0A267FTF3_9PLAT|nr:hypothetical protein BOX15_Mlig005026g3 [Macrostomum lignano]